MPIRPFSSLPKNLVEWGRFFQQTDVTPSNGSVGADQLKDGQVTFQKIQNVTPDRLLGRDTSPAGVVQELTVSGGLEFTGNGIQRSALTGDVTASAGSGTTTLRDGVARSVLGRSEATNGPMADIEADADGKVLVRRAGALVFDTLADADIPAGIARDSEVSSAISTALTNITGGTYSPTLTSVANIDALTTHDLQYMRIGSVVHVSGRIDINPTAAALTQVGISLPVASNIGAAADCAGTGFDPGASQGAAIYGDAANNRAMFEYIATDTANRDFYFTFTYRII